MGLRIRGGYNLKKYLSFNPTFTFYSRFSC